MFIKKFFVWLLILLGFTLILLSPLLNISLLGKFLAQDGTTDNLFVINYFWILKLIIFFIGIILIINKFYIDKLVHYKKELVLLVITLFQKLILS